MPMTIFVESCHTKYVLRVDVKDLKLYQQVFIYIVPIVTNLGFINPAVILVRLYWFRQRFRDCGKFPIPAPGQTG